MANYGTFGDSQVMRTTRLGSSTLRRENANPRNGSPVCGSPEPGGIGLVFAENFSAIARGQRLPNG